ncbi:VapE domain-containing protein [Geothrix campi]|uniref:VapE domain-containing protein n=1 Tax=Geothrix campi TaxID=2966450 RepID=UPI00214720D1|nr:VapE domain-containing protein [Geothrix sp. SG10]
MSAPEIMRPNPLDQALRLLSLGFSVIPLRARDKRPALNSWKPYQERRATMEEVHSWFDGGVDLNIGIVTGAVSNLVAVDGDSLDAVNWLHGTHPSPMRTRTGKGKHFFFRHPGVVIKNNVKLGGMALDVRGDGGYVVAPGSIHPNGAMYEEEGQWAPGATLPMFQPAWLGTKVTPLPRAAHTDGDKRVVAYLDATPGAVEGQGGDAHTFRVACKLVRGFSLNDQQALEYLMAWNSKCVPAWSEADLRVKVASARENGTEPFGYLLDAPQPLRTSYTPLSPAAPTLDDGGAVGLQDILTHTKDGGIKKTPGNLAKILRMDARWGPALALNEMTQAVMFNGQDQADAFVDWVQEQIEDHHGVAFGREDIAAKIMAAAGGHPVHPVREWLKTLRWDGTERIHRVGREILRAESALSTHYLRCTMVGACRRVLQPGTKLDTLPVLVGDQGLGKSTFWRTLIGDQWFGDSPLDVESKDGFMVMHRKWCTELAELDHTTGTKAIERVKAFLSSSEDVYRPPYGRTALAFRRSGFLVGTTNQESFLFDPTGSRRFWPICCTHIDMDLLKKWRDQLWAEAMDLESKGVHHWLDEAREGMRAKDAARFEAEDPWEELIHQAVEAIDIAAIGRGLGRPAGYSLSGLLTHMGIPSAQHTNAAGQRLAKLLRKKGWVRSLTGERRVAVWVQPES